MATSSARGPGRPSLVYSAGTLDRIVDAARSVFGERGYAGTTLGHIGERAGVTRPALYYHFASKQALYRAAVESTETDIADAVEEIKRRQGGRTLLAELSALFTVVAELQDRSAAAFVAPSILELRRHPELATATDRHVLTTTQEYLSSTMHGAITRGELSADIDVTTLVEMLTALWCGVAFHTGSASHENLDAVAESTRHLLAGTLLQIHPDRYPSVER